MTDIRSWLMATLRLRHLTGYTALKPQWLNMAVSKTL